MTNITLERLERLFPKFRSLRVLVLGDLMLDEYLWGRVVRISPEAPVPVVEVDTEELALGGAGNVAGNISSLGAEPIPVGVVGEDPAGWQLIREMEASGFSTSGVVVDKSRQTTVKTRVIARTSISAQQHIVRADRETRRPVDPQIADMIFDFISRTIDDVDAVLFEDYNKGVITEGILKRVTALARERGKLITADPKFDNFFNFRKVTVFKPNQREVESAMGIRISSAEDLVQAGLELLRRLDCEGVLITRGSAGMSLFQKGGEIAHIPTVAKEIFDVSGAGDTVISTLTVALAAGASLKEAATLANYAAGVVISEVGIVPVKLEKLRESLLEAYGQSRII